MDNLNQIRANIAFSQLAETIREWNSEDQKELKSLARSLPAMFQQNGLIATWAFLIAKSRKKKQHEAVAKIVMCFYSEHLPWLGLTTNDSAEIFYQNRLIDDTPDSEGRRPSHRLMELTAETIAFSGWIKRAAEALCTGGN